MGYMMTIGRCFGCGKTFSFNHQFVPSIRDPNSGEKEPVCESCITKANARRAEMGLPPHVIMPNAYEPIDEDEL